MGRACEEDALSISWEWPSRMQLKAATFPPSKLPGSAWTGCVLLEVGEGREFWKGPQLFVA